LAAPLNILRIYKSAFRIRTFVCNTFVGCHTLVLQVSVTAKSGRR